MVALTFKSLASHHVNFQCTLRGIRSIVYLYAHIEGELLNGICQGFWLQSVV